MFVCLFQEWKERKIFKRSQHGFGASPGAGGAFCGGEPVGINK